MDYPQFRALKTFEGENGSIYCEGMKYAVKAGNEELLRYAEQWLEEGKVEWVARKSRAGLSGTAVVS